MARFGDADPPGCASAERWSDEEVSALDWRVLGVTSPRCPGDSARGRVDAGEGGSGPSGRAGELDCDVEEVGEAGDDEAVSED